MKPIKGYCIIDRQGVVYSSTFREWRKDCISDWLKDLGTLLPWYKISKEFGWKTVKCELTPKPPSKN
jgi:acyl-CoA thioesterase FadM